MQEDIKNKISFVVKEMSTQELMARMDKIKEENMKPFKVSTFDNMVNIDSDEISFSWIANMYEGGRAGVGLQVDGMSYDKCMDMCIKIAEAVYNFKNKDKKIDIK